MKKTFIIIGVIFAVCISFVIGLLVGQYNKAKTDLLIRKAEGTTFYAKIDSIRENNGTIHISATGLDVNNINWRGKYNFSIKESTDIVWRGVKIPVSDLGVKNNIAITITDETIPDVVPTPLQEIEKIELLDDKKYGEYEKVADFKEGKYAEEPLVKFNGTLYTKSNKIIDYIGGAAQIGTIDQLIDSDYVPKVDGETNSKELLNAGVYPGGDNEIVLNYNNDYVLYEKV
ncbi:putative uncharacterized protein [Clostridium sp. CAG:508]|jgi:hypothetical protein|nr:hypothetical protein [Clostridia bacterium]CDC30910.1 putative uncharacterized protein [Clostridium sp. CAG:508]